MYIVPNWDNLFESSRSRQYSKKTQAYMPNKIGLGYQRIMREPDGAAIFGAWCAMIQLLSRQTKPRTGVLTDTGRTDGRELDAGDIAIATCMPESLVAKMLDVCCSDRVAWLVRDTIGTPQGHHRDTIVTPQCPSGDGECECKGKGNGKGEGESEGEPATTLEPRDPLADKLYRQLTACRSLAPLTYEMFLRIAQRYMGVPAEDAVELILHEAECCTRGITDVGRFVNRWWSVAEERKLKSKTTTGRYVCKL